MRITNAQAKRIGDKLNVNWNKIDLEQLRRGMQVEQEHSNVVGKSLIKLGKVAHAHLKENPKYYTILKKYNL